jgi:Flp pilus assembly protein TadD
MLLCATVVALVAVGLYANSVVNEFVFDDRLLIEKNDLVRGGGARLVEVVLSPYHAGVGLGASGLYRPVTLASFVVDHGIGGIDPFGYHVTNILLHAAVSVLVLLLALRLGAGRWASLAAGLVFAVHPIHTEAVANLAGRAELLSSLFVLVALVAYIEAGALERGRDRLLIFVAAVAFLLGLLSKENAITFVGVALAYDLLFTRPGEGTRVGAVASRKLLVLLPVLLFYLAARWNVLGGSILGSSEIPFLDNPIAEGGLVTRWMTAWVVAVRYLGLLFFPYVLSPDYSYAEIPPVTSPLDAAFVITFVVTVAVVAVAVVILRASRLAAFSILFGVLTFSIASNLVVPIGTIMAERLVYLPSVGFALLLGMGFAALTRRFGAGAWVVLVLVLALAGARTVTRNRDWRDSLALFSEAARTSPRSAKVHNNLGAALMARDRYAEARESFGTALEIYDGYTTARLNLGQCLLFSGDPAAAERVCRRVLTDVPDNARAHRQLGAALLQQGRLDESERSLRKAAELSPSDPTVWATLGNLHLRRGDTDAAEKAFVRRFEHDPSAAAHNDLALVYRRAGRMPEALERFSRAVELEPRSVPLRNNLADALRAAGDTDGAIAELESALALEPSFAPTHYNLGVALEQAGRLREAEGPYREAVRLEPRHAGAWRALGRLALRSGETATAIGYLDDAIRIDPDDPESRALRGRAYLGSGRIDEAETDYVALRRLNPRSVEAYANLGVIYARRGNRDAARLAWREALRLAPDSEEIRRNLDALDDLRR